MTGKTGDRYFDDGMRRYISKTARRHVQRLAGVDLEDLVQEGYVCYLVCHRRYVGQRPTRKSDGTTRRYIPKRPDPTAQRHFMRLVQRTFGNRISSMARVQSAQVEQSVWQFSSGEPNQTEASIWDGLIPMQHEQATISCMLRNAPRELADLFKLMVSELHEPYRRVKLGRWTLRETSDDYYARQLGMPEGTNISAMLEDYFSPA